MAGHRALHDRTSKDSSPLNGSIIARSFTWRDTIRTASTKVEQSNTDGKGPLGLGTVYDPPDSAVADLVFVHGLGGGSRSTWTKSGDSSLFWPQEWLPKDPAFTNVRIHAFGYDSNWGKESTLNIHDFAKSLIGSIQDCSSMNHHPNIPLILVGHSMGGLVIKKAYILSRQSDTFQTVSQRIQAIFFLATPHRGSELAPLLSKILSVTFGQRPFVQDLHRNSLATQSINDEFPQYCQDLQLFSFYETLPIISNAGKTIIVDKDLATLGYSNERTELINANHRDICKYTMQTDPNYIRVRNALASVIDKLTGSNAESVPIANKELQRYLTRLLNTSDAHEDDLSEANACRMTDSCRWLKTKKTFQTWLDLSVGQIYWMSAKPGTGKTVLSAYLIKHLREQEKACSFYFFNSADKGKSNISAFLLSMAHQTSVQSPEVFDMVLKICEEDDQLGTADFRKLWRRLFIEGIFRVPSNGPQFWVLDALDECSKYSDLIPLLLRASEAHGIHIFITCRSKYEASGHTLSSKTTVLQEEISEENTRHDISLYLKANMHHIPAVTEEDREFIADEILKRSSGCFLWVTLVISELTQVYIITQVADILSNIPPDMDALYSRILETMSNKPHGILLAQSILTWTVCSARPLTTTELHHALELDINDRIDRIDKVISSTCGQLVYVDKSYRVHMVHQTARDFLLKVSTNPDFAIDRKTGHKRLALTCLNFLSGGESRSPRQRRQNLAAVRKPEGPLADYACRCLFEHIAHVSSEDEDFFEALAAFLNSPNILAWIEYLAQVKNLSCLIHTGQAFKRYLQRRSRHLSPFGREFATLDSWATDLVRLMSKFGKKMIESPSSIYNLIPPFCPANSSPRKQFATSKRGISILGLSATDWDDCLSTIILSGEQLTTIACSSQYFIVGTSTGRLVVYDEITCQETRTLRHGEIVKTTQFSQNGRLFASAGMKSVCLWDVDTWQQVWKFDIRHQCLSLGFADADRLLIGAFSNNSIAIWELGNGVLKESYSWTEDYRGPRKEAYRRAVMAAISSDASLLAVVYRGQDVTVWDIESNDLYESYSRYEATDGHSRVFVTGGTAFSLDLESTLLAASYSDGQLIVFDTHKGTIKGQFLAYAQTLTSSADGRTLATADSSGTIQIFDFETLKLLHRINSEGNPIKALAFNKDGHRVLDIRGSECRVWDPAVLLQSDIDDENSDTVSISTLPHEIQLDPLSYTASITALTYNEKGAVHFCGMSDGTVQLYDTRTGMHIQELFSHATGISITLLYFHPPSQILVSVDTSTRVVCHILQRHTLGWQVSAAILDQRFSSTAVDQVLVNDAGTRMLICSAARDTLCDISVRPKVPEILKTISWNDRAPYRWATRPLHPERLILFSEGKLHMYEWLTLNNAPSEGIELQESVPLEYSIRSITACARGTVLVTVFSELVGSRSRSMVLLWDASDISDSCTSSVAPIPGCHLLVEQFQALIGAYHQRLVYLETGGWVCSVDLESLEVENRVRHFFIPVDWLTASSTLIIEVTSAGDILCVKNHETAVIKRGLEASEDSGSGIARPKASRLRSQESDDVFAIGSPTMNGYRELDHYLKT